MNKLYMTIGRSIGMVMMLILSINFFSNYADASTIGATGPRIAVKAGDKITIQFKTSPKIPAVKIELCLQDVKVEHCAVLKSIANGNTALVKIPSNYQSGKAGIRVTGRDTHGKLFPQIQYERAVLVHGKSGTKITSVSKSSCGTVSPTGPTISQGWITGTVQSVRKICDGNYEIVVTNARVGGPTQASNIAVQPIRIRTQPTTSIIEALTVDNPPHIGAWQIQAGDEIGNAEGVYSPSDLMMVQTNSIGVHSDRFVYAYKY
ncbi:MAG TPA: hypothetical protein VLG69_02810 [Candidatus Andersenbacteria bacterium]|nr:hypothetical protein [Candidatus Andersenbacteria bacterium]